MGITEQNYYISYNFPDKINKNQDVKDSVFRAKLDHLLKNYEFVDDNIKSVKAIILYNTDFDQVNMGKSSEAALSKVGSNNNGVKNNNEEGLVFFEALPPKYNFDQVILNDPIKTNIIKTINLILKQDIIYEQWGFKEVDPQPRAVLNFYGPSGTGKTMTAHAIASYLGLKILSLNYSQIESKYVGDAPKNLVRAFETAQKENAVLFFDEADSFLGRRIANISTSSDQAVNSLRSQMLILMENFTGIVLFASNLITNYDKAFETRIFEHIKFDLPDAKNREKIIKVTIPSRVPLESPLTDEEMAELVLISEGFSGRDIKNAVLKALSNAVFENRDFVNYNDFKTMFENVKTIKKELEDACNQSGLKLTADKKSELESKIKEQLAEKQAQPVNAGLTEQAS
ncbi:MAG: ATP-binding protein [Firmicutes bacterium]|nr:ATP-binding protein [Bacillota bacterium]